MNLKEQIIDDIHNQQPILKYAYLNEGASNFIDVTKSKQYYYYRTEMKIIKENIKLIRNSLNNTVVELGVGDGSKLNAILPPDKNAVLVDISEEMLKKAQMLIDRPVTVLNSSFEDINYEQIGDNVTFLFLGGTLGNFEMWENLLAKFKSHCINSNILIGMEFDEEQCSEDIKKVPEGYYNSDIQKFVFNPLRLLGLSINHGKLDVNFNDEYKRIEFYFYLNDEGKAAWFDNTRREAPEKILLTLVNKPTRKTFIEKVKQLGFKLGKLNIASDGISIIEFCW